MKKYKYVISACLCGDNCRYDGKSKPDERAVKLWNEGEAVKVCPEQLGGLDTPRSPCEIIAGRVISQDGEDKTEEYVKGAKKVLEICKEYGIKKAVLKQNSPSCASRYVYDGTFTKKLTAGKGITAKLLEENGIDVIAEDDI